MTDTMSDRSSRFEGTGLIISLWNFMGKGGHQFTGKLVNMQLIKFCEYFSCIALSYGIDSSN